MSGTSKSSTLWHRLLIKQSSIITLSFVLLSLIGFFFGSKIQLKLSLTDLLPDDHPAVVKFNELTKIVGGVGFFTIVLESKDGTGHLAVAPELVKRLETDPLVSSAFFHREQRFFTDRLLYYLSLDQLKELQVNIRRQILKARSKVMDLGLWDEEEAAEEAEKKESKPIFDDKLTSMAKKSASISPYLLSHDKKHLLLMVKPSFDSMELEKTEALMAFSQKVLKDVLPPTVSYEFAERYYNKIVETRLIKTDIFLLGSLSILSIAIILLLYLKSWRALCVIFGPVFMGLGFTMGTTYLVIGHINIVTGFLIGIVSGLGVDYGIHLVLRHRLELREPSSDDPDPVWRTLKSTGHSVFVGAFSAALAFFLLCFSSFKAFSEFGFVCGVGICAVVMCLLCCFSTLVRILGVDKEAHKSHANQNQERLTSGRVEFPVLSIPKGYYAGIFVTVALTIAGTQCEFEYDFNKMLQHSKKMTEMFQLVDTIYDRSSTPSALATDTKEEALAVEALIKEKYSPAIVSEIISGATIIPDAQDEKREILLKIQGELQGIKDKWIEEGMGVPAASVRSWLVAKPFGLKDIPRHVQDALRGTKQSGYLIYLYPAIKLDTAQGVRTYANMVRDFEHRWPKMNTGSDAVIFSDILDLIQRDGLMLLLTIFISVGLFIWFNERSISKTLMNYLPLLITLPVGMGLMAICGVKFNIFNISIIPTFVAMGIDVPIHINHRMAEIKSGYKAVRDLSASINLALMTAAVGFGVLIFARAGVLKSLGWVALLGTIGIWWIGLFILPVYLEKKSRSKAS